MHLLTLVDNRTLIACECLLTAVFAAVLFGLHWLYPHIRGVTFVAAGFLLGIPTTAMLAARGFIPDLFSVVVANGFGFYSYVLPCHGLLQFCMQQRKFDRTTNGSTPKRRTWRLLWCLHLLVAVSIGILFYFSEVQHAIVPRIIAIAFTLAIANALLAAMLFGYSGGRRQMILFGGVMTLASLLSANRAFTTMHHGAPADFMQHDPVQTLSLVMSVLFLAVQGVLWLVMFTSGVAETLEAKAQIDYLTGSLNRHGIEEALAAEIARTRRTSRPFSLLLMDVDHFKEINDSGGHAAGDLALCSVAETIGRIIRVYDHFGRFGGDEFMLLLPETTGERALHTAARIRDELARHSADVHQPVTLSIGVTACHQDEPISRLLERADRALYQAKRAGRDCARMEVPAREIAKPYTPDTRRKARWRRNLGTPER